jgi:hypothetical protein
MKASKTGLALFAATIAIFAIPGAAQAEYLIPPGNSAATQYTEAVPTAGGPKASNPSKHVGSKSPKQVLGKGNAKKLDAQGPEGQAAAEVAAATAPVAVSAGGEGNPPTSGHASPGNAANGPGSGSGGSGANGGGSPSHGASGNTPGSTTTHDATLASEQIPNGSSGLGEVLGQATGSSSGQLGLLLPLIVLGTIAWSVAYVVRRRRQPTH